MYTFSVDSIFAQSKYSHTKAVASPPGVGQWKDRHSACRVRINDARCDQAAAKPLGRKTDDESHNFSGNRDAARFQVANTM